MVGDDGSLARSLDRQFRRRGHDHIWLRRPEELAASPGQPEELACVVAADPEAAKVTRTASQLLATPGLSAVPLEYATGLEPEQAQFRRQDEYGNTMFVSPVLLAEHSPYRIYDESLERFEQKCGLRDYLDLYQMLVSIEERRVPGDVVEFGSYKGHSGWLIGRTLETLRSGRAVHLFDTFESFPQESVGIDYFWGGTHEVHLEEVRAKMSELPAVRLVPGDFEQTVPHNAPERIALAYIDCDSYRAVGYLARTLFEDRLVPGGAMVFEDYGHPALLGCRVAVHEYFDGRGDSVRFFSQFSGLYIVVKLPADGGPVA
jgi:predicted O-methyltransferase YrrM